MKRLVIAPCSRSIERVLRAVGLDDETMVVLFSYRACNPGVHRSVVVDSTDISRSVSMAIKYSREFDRVRVVVSDFESPYQAISTLLTFVALSSLEPLHSFKLEDLAVYHLGRVREFSGRLRLGIKSLRDLEILGALSEECMDCHSISEKCSIPFETTRRRLAMLNSLGLVSMHRVGRKNLYCLTDFGRMFAI